MGNSESLFQKPIRGSSGADPYSNVRRGSVETKDTKLDQLVAGKPSYQLQRGHSHIYIGTERREVNYNLQSSYSIRDYL